MKTSVTILAIALASMVAGCSTLKGDDTAEVSANALLTRPANQAEWEKASQARFDASAARMEKVVSVQSLNPMKPAIVHYMVTPAGEIRDVEIVRSSGLAPFDTYAMRYIVDAAPLPPFSADMPKQNLFRVGMIAFGPVSRERFGGDDAMRGVMD